VPFPLRTPCGRARHRGTGVAKPAVMRYYLAVMARTKQKAPTEPLRVYSLKVTAAAEQLLQDLSQDASDALGWTVSSSAILRALLAYVAQQPPAWASATLYPFIEREIAQGRVWGSTKRSRS
jgi:hypothetical protein